MPIDVSLPALVAPQNAYNKVVMNEVSFLSQISSPQVSQHLVKYSGNSTNPTNPTGPVTGILSTSTSSAMGGMPAINIWSIMVLAAWGILITTL
ncbi:hypothetical protein CVT25_013574 [Psilocybe cyanescens]|uniref:Uncharacterized protein n=1 Tax=Psilocybe cyanescens TaxID=93625 RepID=A0A409XT34_PSICY|nr:hypothetical protein CVT25_013574 [Psilocybe cyanescens]